MNRIVILTALGVSSLLAQDTLSTEAKQRWTQTKNNLIAAAEKMDEANYDFKPAAESQSFRLLCTRGRGGSCRKNQMIDGLLQSAVVYRRSAGASSKSRVHRNWPGTLARMIES